LFDKMTTTRLQVQGLEIGVRLGVGEDGRELIEVTNFPARPDDRDSPAQREFLSAFQRELARVKARKYRT
jgi:hypothetical protein